MNNLPKVYERLGLGGLISILSILVAIGVSWYFYQKSEREKLPVYAYTDPLELDTAAIPKIKIFFEEELPGTPYFLFSTPDSLLEGPYKKLSPPGIILPRVVSTKILFWNKGREPIESPDILKDLFIEISLPDRILYAKAIDTTREVCDIQIEPFKEKGSYTNKARISFRILEKDDGASFEIVHTGPRNTVPKITGEIKGAKGGIECVGKLGKVRSVEMWVQLLYVVLSLCLYTYAMIPLIKRGHMTSWKRIMLGVPYAVSLLVLTYYIIPVLYKARAFPPELYPFK